MVREPYKRLISHYNYALCNPKHYLHDIVSNNMSFYEYVLSGISNELDNGQVRMLAGWDDEIPFGKCSKEMLKKAKENIDRFFAFVGITERFDESILLVQKEMRWKKYPFYEKKKVNLKRKPLKISDREFREIIELSEYDYDLYDYVSATFEQKVDKSLSAKELDTYRRLNRRYQMLMKPKQLIKAKLNRLIRIQNRL